MGKRGKRSCAVFISCLFALLSCNGNKINDSIQDVGTPQMIAAPPHLSEYGIGDTVHFVLVTDTAEPLQVLRLWRKNDCPVTQYDQIAHIFNFTILMLGDTATTKIVGSSDTLAHQKAIKLNWRIPDYLEEGVYEIRFHHFSPGTGGGATIKIIISTDRLPILHSSPEVLP